ncbi:tRNA 2-thiouridine(34) synthase MnmA [Deferribacterales bacterium RsTz2092]|nr:tRNA-specific 2-thiouridylase MnmA [Deferribacterales bacterium]
MRILVDMDFSPASLELVRSLEAEYGANNITCVSLKLVNGELETKEAEIKNYSKFFSEDVLSAAIAAYRRGELLSPCFVCAQRGIVQYLFDEAQRAGCEKIATTCNLPLMGEFHRELFLVRTSTTDANLSSSHCSCPFKSGDYRTYLANIAGYGKAGNFIYNNAVVGKHTGVLKYIVGQHNLADELETHFTQMLYIKALDVNSGDIMLADKAEMFFRILWLKDCVFYAGAPVLGEVDVVLRSKLPAKPLPCIMERRLDGTARVLLDKAQFALQAGQLVKFFVNDTLIGGGVVERSG